MALTSLGVLGMTASWAVAALASLLAGLVFVLPKVLKTWKPELSVDKQTVSSMMKFSLSNYLGNLFYIGPSLFLPIVITVMLSVDETAYFRISWLFASILSIIPSASAFSLYAEGSVGPGTTGPKVKTATLFTFGLLLPALAVMLIFGHDLLSFVGQEYADNAFSSLKVFALASIPLAANTIYIAVKRIEKDSVAILWVYGVMAALFLSLSWLTMTHQRLDGIANSWLATQIVISALIAIVELKKMLVRKSNVQPSE
jgi:O-antigen/teichoic acid export membrane protein